MRLIDADAAIDAVEFECGEWRGLARTIVKGIKQLPTIEQPKIIHCKDCKKHHLGFGFCPMVHHSAENPLMVYELNDDDDFCSRAERGDMSRQDEDIRELIRLIYSICDYAKLGMDVSTFDNCNNCKDKKCKYKPKWGDMVRWNCPLWKGTEDA